MAKVKSANDPPIDCNNNAVKPAPSVTAYPNVVHDGLYRFWCISCLYSLAIWYTFIELWLKVRKYRGDNVLALNESKDRLKKTPEDWTVMITGGERGIGWETTKMLLARNCHVIILGLTFQGRTEQQTLADLRSELKTAKEQALLHFWRMDLSSLKSVSSVAERARRQNIRLNTLINNAGQPFNYFKSFEEDRTINVSLYRLEQV
jgi:hypothetical protein